MFKPADPRDLAIDLLSRSICFVRVAAVICDPYHQIISWGWNSVGSGFGLHAEVHAIGRANPARLEYGTIYVASKRKKKAIMSKPCEECERLIKKWHLSVVYRASDGVWYG